MRQQVLRLSTVIMVGVLLASGAPATVQAGEFVVRAEARTDLKAVFGQVESRDLAVARARIGGTVLTLAVEEGSSVKAGDVIATVVDDKMALQLDAVDARLRELQAQLGNATTELNRAKTLLQSGAVPKSRVDALQTQLDVVTNQLSAAQADRSVVVQQASEGQVLAPAPGRVLTVPITKGSVVMPGETIARIAGGGYFLRLSVPERHASQIAVGNDVLVAERGSLGSGSTNADKRQGRIVKVYPEIEGGQVLADADVDGLGDFFVGERTLVWIPVNKRNVIAVPRGAVSERSGVDYVSVKSGATTQDVAVVTGESFSAGDGSARIEILSGLQAGDLVVTP